MSTTKEKSTDIIETMAEWFDKFPPLPKNWKDVIVKIAPILCLIAGIIGIIAAILGGAAGFASYGTGILGVLIYLVGSVLYLLAYPGLRARKYKGWKLLFWSGVVNLIGGLVSLAILSAIIGALIGFYLIFQIRSYYK
jgi:hypothetical protein